MSTVDPDAARRDREQRLPTLRELALPAIVSFVLPTLAALAVSRMLANAIMNDVFDGASIAALVLAFPGTGAAIFAIIRWASLAARNPKLLDISAALGLALLGIAAGLSVAALPPAWVRAPLLRPEAVVLGICGIALLGYSAWARHRRIRRIGHEEELMKASSSVTGTVTNRGYDHPSNDASALLTTVTYGFVDAAGTRRYVRKRERLPMDDLVEDGERVDVWYDRRDPSDETRIVVRRRPRDSGSR